MIIDPTVAAVNATGGAHHRKKATRVFLRVKRKRSPAPSPAQKLAITTKADAVDDDVAAGANHGISSRGKRKSKSIAPERIKLALPAFDPADVVDATKRSKRRRMSPSIFDNKEGSSFLQRLSSVNLDHCEAAQEKPNNATLLFTPSRAQKGGVQRISNPLDSSDGGDDEQRTPPSYSFDTTKDCKSKVVNNQHSNGAEEEIPTEQPLSQAPVKPKRTVIFRKITDLRKCLDNLKEQQQPPEESPSQSTMQAVKGDKKKEDFWSSKGEEREKWLAVQESKMNEDWSSKGEEQAKWLRIVDVRLEADDEEDVSSCSDNSGDYDGGAGPRVRRMRTRPSEDDGGENTHNRRTKKRRKLGVAVEHSQTVLESTFLGNMNADKFHADDCVLDPEVIRLIDYSLASLHNQNGGSVSPHLSFLRIDPRLGFVANTPSGKQMVNRQYHGTGNGLADGRGRSVLHIAALWGDMAGVRAAIDMGADPTILDGQGLTPARLAKLYGQENVFSALMEENNGESEKKKCDHDEADYYYELYCLEEGNDEADKKNNTEEEKKDEDSEDDIIQLGENQRSSSIGTDSPPGLARAKNWDEDEDDYRFELSQGVGGWTEHGELILEACGKSHEKDDAFIQRLYNNQAIDDDDSMVDDEHDSNDERYDGNDYPDDDDDQSFGPGSNYDDDYQDADYYRPDHCSDDESDDGGWKLDFRKRVQMSTIVNLDYESNEEGDYAGPMCSEKQETIGGFAYDSNLDESE